jgi:hypothetical protein
VTVTALAPAPGWRRPLTCSVCRRHEPESTLRYTRPLIGHHAAASVTVWPPRRRPRTARTQIESRFPGAAPNRKPVGEPAVPISGASGLEGQHFDSQHSSSPKMSPSLPAAPDNRLGSTVGRNRSNPDRQLMIAIARSRRPNADHSCRLCSIGCELIRPKTRAVHQITPPMAIATGSTHRHAPPLQSHPAAFHRPSRHARISPLPVALKSP